MSRRKSSAATSRSLSFLPITTTPTFNNHCIGKKNWRCLGNPVYSIISMKPQISLNSMNKPRFSSPSEDLSQRIAARTARAGVIGLGYVGLPLAMATANAGFTTIGFDVDPGKAEKLNAGKSYIDAVPSMELADHVNAGRFQATTDFTQLAQCDIIVICVPTPLSRNREPDLSFICKSGDAIAKNLRRGQLIVLESTSYPGTTNDVLKPILEHSGLVSGQDFWMGFSPERETR